MIPTSTIANSTEGTVLYRRELTADVEQWRVVLDVTAEEVDLDEFDLREAQWQHRCRAEQWYTEPCRPDFRSMVGTRLLRQVPGCSTVNAAIVAYLPADGADEAMWHCVHDDGDHEDLTYDEVVRGQAARTAAIDDTTKKL
eukprot:SAG22_NODE_6671_length_824_cov_27.141928_1_plen_140_part_10